MADDVTPPTTTPPAPAEAPATPPIQEKPGLLQRASEQIKKGLQGAAEGYMAGLQGSDASGIFGPQLISFTLKGTAEVAGDITKVRPSDQIRPMPRLDKIPDLKIPFTTIRTGLGAEVDRVLERSRKEIESAITQTYDVMKTRVFGLQTSMAVLDKNIKVVDVRTKRFQEDSEKTLAKLQSQLRKIEGSQQSAEQKFMKIGLPEKKTDATPASGVDLTSLGLLGGLLPFIPALVTIGSIVKLSYDEFEEIKKIGIRPYILKQIKDHFFGPSTGKTQVPGFGEVQPWAAPGRAWDKFSKSGYFQQPGPGWDAERQLPSPGRSFAPGAKRPTTFWEDVYGSGSYWLGGTPAQAGERATGMPPVGYRGPMYPGSGGYPSMVGGPQQPATGGVESKMGVPIYGGWGQSSAAPGQRWIGAPGAAAYGISPRGGGAMPGGSADVTGMIGQPSTRAPVTGDFGRYLHQYGGEPGYAPGLESTREQILGRAPSTMFGPRAPGIPERPGLFGYIGQDPGLIRGLGEGGVAGGFFGGAGLAGGARPSGFTGGAQLGGGPRALGGGARPGAEAAAPAPPPKTAEQQKIERKFIDTGEITVSEAKTLFGTKPDGTINAPPGVNLPPPRPGAPAGPAMAKVREAVRGAQPRRRDEWEPTPSTPEMKAREQRREIPRRREEWPVGAETPEMRARVQPYPVPTAGRPVEPAIRREGWQPAPLSPELEARTQPYPEATARRPEPSRREEWQPPGAPLAEMPARVQPYPVATAGRPPEVPSALPAGAGSIMRRPPTPAEIMVTGGRTPEERAALLGVPSPMAERRMAGAYPGAPAAAGRPLGWASLKYESGSKGVASISSGRGDKGGVSYGEHQFATNTGDMAEYIRSPENAPWAKRFEGLAPGTEAFNKVYSQIAAEQPKEFAAAQLAKLTRTHYEGKAVPTAKALGYDLSNEKVREAVFSMSIQHGGVAEVIRNAGDATGKSPEEQVNALFDAREKYWPAGRGRYRNERADILAITPETGTATAAAAAAGAAPVQAAALGESRVAELQAQVAGVRRGSLKGTLKDQLEYSAAQAGVYVDVTSGGQRMEGAPGATGSHRHDEGGAADVNLYVMEDGKKRVLDPRKEGDQPLIAKFTTEFSRVNPEAGVGASYMSDPTKIHYGGANAPGGQPVAYEGAQWFREAHATGIAMGQAERAKDIDTLASWKSSQETQVAASAVDLRTGAEPRKTEFPEVTKADITTPTAPAVTPTAPAAPTEPSAGEYLKQKQAAAEQATAGTTQGERTAGLPQYTMTGGEVEQLKAAQAVQATRVGATQRAAGAYPGAQPKAAATPAPAKPIAITPSKETAAKLAQGPVTIASQPRREVDIAPKRDDTRSKDSVVRAPKEGEKKESSVKKKEEGSRQQAASKPKGSAVQPKQNQKAPSQDLPSAPGDRGTGGGGGGGSPERCHFCDP